MQKRCFARWYSDSDGNIYRDGALLQFGNSWQLLGSVILLNPGSAKPLDEKPCNKFLCMHLEGFDDKRDYYACSVDPLMRALIEIFTQRFPDGGRNTNLQSLQSQKSKIWQCDRGAKKDRQKPLSLYANR